ncbi:Polyketide synthase/Fatty acid synthase, KR [Moorella glycerini]|uniref:2-dehydro-3-deoxy-D-gluconate 5-dehydrogenase n=1 Tax=Neomoorella stamsii TaxID=1266720 RepID=A0A9X7J5E2_9FIRM|nr:MULTISPECIES: glucose 1-dehydrogenase [Moorella]PRR74564.1 2-dehydro-3-deoxy-D-gluconate 5-dehydrogenase [Moorella stamsii]CEP69149.1 Polyketide synthase/Fatty acid synthase, KR [Moorella glycerini]
MTSDYRNLFDLNGQVALVVGGTGGIGRAMTLALAQYGADIVVASRKAGAATDLQQEIESLGRKYLAFAVDILNAGELRAMVDKIDATFGRLDILVNTAGTNIWQKAEEYSEENWDRVLDVNLKGVFLTCREVGRLMIRQRKGKIISISSVRGKLGFPENYTAYCASKGGLNLYTKCLAAEWAKYNINVNAIAPTFIETPLVADMLADQETYNKLVNRIPLHRLGVPADLVGATLFFASRASDFITGQILYVDGGVTCTQ